jgi:hypothetical protein
MPYKVSFEFAAWVNSGRLRGELRSTCGIDQVSFGIPDRKIERKHKNIIIFQLYFVTLNNT